jgi:hypothetical protein
MVPAQRDGLAGLDARIRDRIGAGRRPRPVVPAQSDRCQDDDPGLR